LTIGTFYVIKAIISLIFGVAFAAIPDAAMGMYGVTLDAVAASQTRYFGAMLIGVGLVCLTVKSAEAQTQRGVTLALFVADTIGFIVALVEQFSPEAVPLGWINVIIWLALAVGLGYFRFGKPTTA
jgi:hypothetical protein